MILYRLLIVWNSTNFSFYIRTEIVFRFIRKRSIGISNSHDATEKSFIRNISKTGQLRSMSRGYIAVLLIFAKASLNLFEQVDRVKQNNVCRTNKHFIISYFRAHSFVCAAFMYVLLFLSC